jgi:hypothetical protein
MARSEQNVTRRIPVLLIVLVVAVAGSLGVYAIVATNGGSHSTVKSDGPTLYQALSEVNNSVRNVSGGPWVLFSVWGVAAQSPFSPNVIGYPSQNHTVNSCGQQFDGLTLWNGTMPLFNGTFDSGTAPFWQFAFFSNVSQTILLATDTLGMSKVYAPMPYPSPCNPWYDLGSSPWRWTLPPGVFPVDSPNAAQSAWGVVDQKWVKVNEPEVELITIGPGMFDGFGDVSGYGVFFDRCGQLGVAGLAEPLVLVGENLQGQWRGTENLTHNCALPFSGYGSLDGIYDLLFSGVSVSTTYGTISATAPFQVALAYPNDTLTNDFDGSGLANWMTHLSLTTSVGQHLPLAAPTCRYWVPSVGSCTANSSGWFAVVLSASGEWINSYGELANGTAGWSEPVTALVSHQQLVIVVPSSWNLTGDELNLTSTVITSEVTGSLML